jgi:hypothetical protein
MNCVPCVVLACLKFSTHAQTAQQRHRQTIAHEEAALAALASSGGGVQLMQLDVTRVHVPPLAIHANPLLARFDAETLRYGSAFVASEIENGSMAPC